MARLSGVVLPDEKRIVYALTLVYGIGWARAERILENTKISPEKKVKEITEEEMKKISTFIDKNFKIEGNLREEINDHIKRLRENGMYRGMRHIRGLPSRGQRTRSNARTKRGKRKTVGALTKEVWAKLEQTQAKTK